MASDFAAFVQLAADPLQGVLRALSEYAVVASAMLAQAFSEYPVLVVAVGLAAAVPLLAVIGLLVPRKRKRHSRPAGHSADPMSRSGLNPASVEDTHLAEPVLRLGAVTADPRSGPVRIGSDPCAHLRCDGPGIEPLHALITLDPAQGLQLVRLASASSVGVYVDGKTVSRCGLSGGETIKIGHNIFVFDTHDGMSSGANQSAIEAATNPILSAVAAARREAGADSTRATWRAEETAGAINARVDHSSVH